MELEEKVKLLGEKLQKFNQEKEGLRRQIAFSEEWISKLEVRLNKPRESNDYVWHSAAGSCTDISSRLKAEAELESQKRSLASLKSEYSSVSHKVKLLEERLKAERSKEFDFGWQKKETEDLPGARASGGGLSVHSSEMKALKVIAEEGGSTVFVVVSRKMGVSTDYARLLCMSLGKTDYIDITPEGRCKITSKGEKELEKKGFIAWL